MKHQRRLGDLKREDAKKAKLQENIRESFEGLTQLQLEKQASLIGLTRAFAGANIPLHTLDNDGLKIYFQSNLKTIGTIPSAGQLRKNYLPKAFDSHL